MTKCVKEKKATKEKTEAILEEDSSYIISPEVNLLRGVDSERVACVGYYGFKDTIYNQDYFEETHLTPMVPTEEETPALANTKKRTLPISEMDYLTAHAEAMVKNGSLSSYGNFNTTQCIPKVEIAPPPVDLRTMVSGVISPNALYTTASGIDPIGMGFKWEEDNIDRPIVDRKYEAYIRGAILKSDENQQIMDLSVEIKKDDLTTQKVSKYPKQSAEVKKSELYAKLYSQDDSHLREPMFDDDFLNEYYDEDPFEDSFEENIAKKYKRETPPKNDGEIKVIEKEKMAINDERPPISGREYQQSVLSHINNKINSQSGSFFDYVVACTSNTEKVYIKCLKEQVSSILSVVLGVSIDDCYGYLVDREYIERRPEELSIRNLTALKNLCEVAIELNTNSLKTTINYVASTKVDLVHDLYE